MQKKRKFFFTNQDCVIKKNKFLKFPKTKEQLNIGKLGLRREIKTGTCDPKYNQYVVELVVDVPLNKSE